ncbi:nucleoside-diphosphate-sugar epimerase [Luteibacter sp. Sphag1AF]|uniref:NAD-dependent epimerase/dehydratase family protein n=1 Tax=Luteibacter sp. Sphag1AF TaxID=2587031 RepID=UPI00161BBE18|nr:NAD-dependent epimerase/dehydratase family protein [Luteibacter sp. Sphag1AF]MBB3225485.1 nucleoside-diphosphate-sugar epimerase [Luteibacter sp. Sphag1AF]
MNEPGLNHSILVAGAGDVGGRAAALLAASGHSLWALRRRPVADSGDGIRWIQADLASPDTLRQLPRVSHVIFAPTPDARDEAAYRSVFVDGLRHLLAALNPETLQRVIFVSSSAVYGDHAGAWVDEDTPPAPPGFNGAVLLEAEQVLASSHVPSTVLRLAGLYGPGRTQLFQALRDGKVRVPREQRTFANRMHVDDAAAALAHLLTMDDPDPLYVGVDDAPLAIDELYDYLAGLLGVPPPAEGPGPHGVGNKRLSNARLRAAGFQCRWPDARAGYAALLRRAMQQLR